MQREPMLKMLTRSSNKNILSITLRNLNLSLILYSLLRQTLQLRNLSNANLLRPESKNLFLKGALLDFPLEDIVEGDLAGEFVEFLRVLEEDLLGRLVFFWGGLLEDLLGFVVVVVMVF